MRAARRAGVPVVASFTVETDGRLPDGTTIADAVEQVDDATGGAAEFFGINCAHPTHIAAGVDDAPSLGRIGALRVNASALSHAELDEAEELDEGDPERWRATASRCESCCRRSGCSAVLRHRPPPRRANRRRLDGRSRQSVGSDDMEALASS